MKMILIRSNQFLLILLSINQIYSASLELSSNNNDDIEKISINKERRLTNAENVKPGNWRFMVSILNTFPRVPRLICSGEILTDRLILTAAHCLMYRPEFIREAMVVAFGTNPIERPILQIRVESVLVHLLYGFKTFRYDVGLIRLKKPIPKNFLYPVPLITSFLRPILNRTHDFRPFVNGDHCMALGYGPEKYNKSIADIQLRQLPIPLLTKDKCPSSQMKQIIMLSSDRICASNKHKYLPNEIPYRSISSGDSGGAYLCPIRMATIQQHKFRSNQLSHKYMEQNYVLVGVTSFIHHDSYSQNDGTIIDYGVFSNILYYHKWLERSINNYRSTSDIDLKILAYEYGKFIKELLKE